MYDFEYQSCNNDDANIIIDNGDDGNEDEDGKGR